MHIPSVLLAANIGVYMLLLGGCESRHAPPMVLQFQLPDGFRGPFSILERQDGQPLDKSARSHVWRIPDHGVLYVTSVAPLNEMRSWSARYVGGGEIPVYDVDDAAIALRGGRLTTRSHHEPRFEFFIGTRDDFEKFDFSAWKENKRSQS